MMSMNFLPVVYIEKMKDMEANEKVENCDFKNDLLYPGSFVAECL